MTFTRVAHVLFSIISLLVVPHFSAQTVLSSTWFTPLDKEALRGREIADSLEAMMPCLLPLPDWAGDVHGSGKRGVAGQVSEKFGGLNIDGETRFIQGDDAGTATIIGLRVYGDFDEIFHYEISRERWKTPVPQHLYDSAIKWGQFDGVGRVSGGNPGSGSARALQIDRFVFRTSIKLSESIELSLGNGPHHWGPGIRSLYFDRSMSPAPYARLYIDTGPIHYAHILLRTTHPMEVLDSNEIGWVAAHMVDVSLGAGFSGSLFGAVKWRSNDDGVSNRIEASYLIPVVAFRPTEYALGSADNALIGAQLIWRGSGRRSRNLKTLYGQLMFDELLTNKLVEGTSWWGNKWGILAGASLNSPSGKWGGVLEGSAVRPFTYSHATEIQAWTHARKPLGPPLGSNFVDIVLRLKWVVQEEYIVRFSMERVFRGLDYASGPLSGFSTGSDVFRSYLDRENDYGSTFLQGVESEFQRLSIDIARPTGGAFGISGIEVFVRGSIRVESHFSADGGGVAIIDPFNSYRIQGGIRTSRVLEGRDW